MECKSGTHPCVIESPSLPVTLVKVTLVPRPLLKSCVQRLFWFKYDVLTSRMCSFMKITSPRNCVLPFAKACRTAYPDRRSTHWTTIHQLVKVQGPVTKCRWMLLFEEVMDIITSCCKTFP
jgi:hypothetical protein